MNKRPARRAFLSQWFLELSVLLAVFPGLDQALRHELDGRLSLITTGIVVVTFGIGLRLAEPER